MEPVISLEDETPENNEEVFVYDSCWGEWYYSTYESKGTGIGNFSIGHNSCGEELYADRPTHFWRVTLPEIPKK